MKYGLRGEDLLMLQKAKGNICISVIVPTHRTSPDRRVDKPEVEEAIDKAKQLLQIKYPEKDIKPLLQSLDDQLEAIDFVHNTEGIGLYISPGVKVIVHFPFPVEEKIMVDNNFEIRDLLYKLNYDQPYYVLMLTEKEAKLFEGSWNNLSEIKGDHWPWKYEDEYVYSKPARSSSFAGHAHVKIFEKDKTELEHIRFTNFFREIDKKLNDCLMNNTPLIILAPERENSLFEKISMHRKNIIHKIHGSYGYENLKSISDIVWPGMYEHLQTERKQLINEFKEMIGEHRDVFAALTQRRQPDRQHVQPVEEVLAELPFGDHPAQAALRPGDDPHVDGNRARASHALHHALLNQLARFLIPSIQNPAALIRPRRLRLPLDLSRDAITEARRNDLPLDVVWLPCGHYTTGELPWKAIDAWKIATFFRKQFKD